MILDMRNLTDYLVLKNFILTHRTTARPSKSLGQRSCKCNAEDLMGNRDQHVLAADGRAALYSARYHQKYGRLSCSDDRSGPGEQTAMLVVMHGHATAGEVERVLDAIRQMGLTPHPMPGATRTAIGITGNTAAIDPRTLEVLPGVFELIRVTKPYKLASREMHAEDTVVRLPQGTFGERHFTIIAGPCSVENDETVLRTAEWLMARGVGFLRAGAFKPRTSPYAFQGLGKKGLDILRRARERTGIGIVTEVMDTENVDAVEASADVIQIGARNMQNFSLLRRLARRSAPFSSSAECRPRSTNG